MDSIQSKQWEHSIRLQRSNFRQFHSQTIWCNRNKELVGYTRQMATLLKANIPVVQSLELIQKQPHSVQLNQIIASQIEALRNGRAYSDTLLVYDSFFDSMYIHLIRAGERASVLDVVFDRLAVYLEKRSDTNRNIQGALIYPSVVLLASIAIVVGLLVFIVPQFEDIFSSMLQGAPLPAMTQYVLRISEVVQSYWWLGFIFFLGLIFSKKYILKLPFFRNAFDWLCLRIPFAGGLVLHSLLARFSRTLSMLLDSSVPLLNAIEIASNTMGNVVLDSVFTRVRESVAKGNSLSEEFSHSVWIPPLYSGLIQIGEETGELSEMLWKLSDIYEKEVEATVGQITTLIEPIMILLLAGMIGFLVVALFLPIVEIMQYIGS